jgi:hypothetical protein
MYTNHYGTKQKEASDGEGSRRYYRLAHRHAAALFGPAAPRRPQRAEGALICRQPVPALRCAHVRAPRRPLGRTHAALLPDRAHPLALQRVSEGPLRRTVSRSRRPPPGARRPAPATSCPARHPVPSVPLYAAPPCAASLRVVGRVFAPRRAVGRVYAPRRAVGRVSAPRRAVGHLSAPRCLDPYHLASRCVVPRRLAARRFVVSHLLAARHFAARCCSWRDRSGVRAPHRVIRMSLWMRKRPSNPRAARACTFFLV